MIYECVPNVAEGRNVTVVEAIGAAAGGTLLDVHTDRDHDRSVFTLAELDPLALEAATQRLARCVAERVDGWESDGVHPRLGALDVVPFVALGGGATEREVAAGFARRFADWAGTALAVPCFLYDDADPLGRSLPSVRAEAFAPRWPDHGPMEPHPRLGAIAVGARPPLVALNCELSSPLEIARDVARAVRERDGGLPGVRALGLELASRRRSQVSMNLVDLEATGIETAVAAVRAAAARADAQIERVEIVGLLPERELARCSAGLRAAADLTPDRTVEARLRSRRGDG